MTTDSSSSDHLVAIALPIFGRQGLEGASTRQIAQAAGRPMSAITYHFGGKDGLYLACARHISATIDAMVGSVVDDLAPPTDIAEARAQLHRLFGALTIAMVRNETAEFARFIVREQQEPTAAFDIIYGDAMGKVLARMVDLMRTIAGGSVDEIDLRVRVIALMGQVMAFRIARAATLRLTGWSDVGADEHLVIDRIVQAHLRAILDSLTGGQAE